MGVPIDVPFMLAPFMLLVPVLIELGVCIS
jgi:hypothetical protein